MQNKTTIWLIAFVFMFCDINAQLCTNEKPASFNKSLISSFNDDNSIPVVIMPQLDMEKIEKEDIEDEKYDMPPRFGYQHKVDYNLSNSGIWHNLPNGDKLWQLNVVCPNALSVSFCYNKFWIPEGGKFFVYSKDKKSSIGAFTSKNNKGDKEHVRGFATGLVYSSDVVLEYYQPKEVLENAIINIEYVVHGYRYIKISEKSYGGSGNCMVNVNCDEGKEWQNEKKAIALLLVNNSRYCTGSLVNTTNLSQEPFLLTANHCINRYGDAENNPELDYYSFYWNYEAPGCLNEDTEPAYYSTSGATILANDSISDFALLQLSEDPKELSNYTPYYLGWDNSGLSGSGGVCIHHPSGDVKKISTVAGQPVSTPYLVSSGTPNDSHWQVFWASTINGHSTTEPGSSGSPLFTSEHKVIGQLHGGYANCTTNINQADWYGKFNVSWTDQGNNNSIYRRLNCWLDPANTGVQTKEGLLVVNTEQSMSANQLLYSNILITHGGKLTVLGDIELFGDSDIIVEAGGKLVVDSGSLTCGNLILKSAASLQIQNNGVIATNNAFDANVGATVDISSGTIF